ncbi:hypothetical protein C8A00DRAFT_36248 [Chaetomidium leptoderma]|uniref:Uncharacterized protein n=1 Tax=Chaetomidium leptoderma TaxID=669021 RepID=A0AAN6VHB7_9PEZI|nr:hypothetical protein C8A00DRAFT_36248 [Chaetomidium leptoderma]
MTHEYPGWNLDLRWTDQQRESGLVSRETRYPMGIHFNCYGGASEMLLVREVAMMLVMDRLTDKPDWHVKVFDDEIAEKWKLEALAWPDDDLWNRISNFDRYWEQEDRWLPKNAGNILNKECVDYCILELRRKAKHFEHTGIIPTLDATFSIAKSDVLVPSELHSALRKAFVRLQADQASNPDWHPNTGKTVQDLVHPSMYPLVYGRSRFFPEEVVGVEDAVDKWAGKGEVIPRRPEWGEESTERTGRSHGVGAVIGGSDIDKSYWSTMYQWLPANVKFMPDGGVRFTSYINNLHPTKYRDVYTTIEKLIETALPMWDQCLAQHRRGLVGAGRHKPRIVPENCDDGNPNNWDIKSEEEMLAMEAAAAEGAHKPAIVDLESLDWDERDAIKERWRAKRQPIQPQPPPFPTSKVRYAIDPGQTLREQFEESGLQIIVKMASIELTPENPEFAPGGWHVEGQMNEHIVGTALYYLDSENITDTHLDFRALTSAYGDDRNVGQQAFYWMERVYGAKLGDCAGSACVQNYGAVSTPQGRLLAFPNVLQHRVSGFQLADPTKPGHRRFIALWLVDPFTRIISTANVPPQQAEWWAEEAFSPLLLSKKKDDGPSTLSPQIAQLLVERGLGESQLSEALTAAGKTGDDAKLPPELMNMVRKELGEALPMTRKEAEERRLELMRVRSSFQEEAREHWSSVEYSFCEH